MDNQLLSGQMRSVAGFLKAARQSFYPVTLQQFIKVALAGRVTWKYKFVSNFMLLCALLL